MQAFVCTCNHGFTGDGFFCESKAKPQQIMSSQDGATGLASSEAPLPKQQQIFSIVNYQYFGIEHIHCRLIHYNFKVFGPEMETGRVKILGPAGQAGRTTGPIPFSCN